MDAYEDLKSLGRGAFATCRLVRKKDDGELFVVKKFHVPMHELSVKERLEIAQEVKLLAHLTHVNIIKFSDNFVEKGIMHIVMEYATGGTLDKKIMMQEGELFEEDQIWEWFVQIVLALRHVHACNVLHRDLKTMNIMLSGPQQRTIKLGDFGIAKVLGSRNEMANTMVGTPHYLSPELCQGQDYDQKSDVWALGCVLYEMASLQKPFDASNMPAIIFSIMRNKPKPLPSGYSEDLHKMVNMLLQPDPKDRPTMAEIAKMPIVEYHISKWHETCRRLAQPLPTPSGPRLAVTGVGATPTTGAPPTGLMSPGPGSEGADFSFTMSPRKVKAESTISESKMLEQIEEIKTLTDPNRTTELNAVMQQLGTANNVSGKVWEAVGGAYADLAHFDDAIECYRRALRAKVSASLGAMEQLGNLLVRRAQQVWAMAKAGNTEEADRVAKDILIRGTSSARSSKNAAVASVSGRLALIGGGGGATEEWQRCARSLMMEGLGLLERLCLLGETVERRALLGSAYKRRAWTGLGESRKADLRAAAKAYADAALMESAEAEAEAEDGDGTFVGPVSYARLNQLTFEILSGTTKDRSRLLEQVKAVEAQVIARREIDAKDVWLWVQGVDAMCLRFLLGDKAVNEDAVVSAYREQLAFGASKRVAGSVMDQFAFLEEVLGGRVAEEEDELEREGLVTQLEQVRSIHTRLRKDRAVNGGEDSADSKEPTKMQVTSSFAAQSKRAQASLSGAREEAGIATEGSPAVPETIAEDGPRASSREAPVPEWARRRISDASTASGGSVPTGNPFANGVRRRVAATPTQGAQPTPRISVSTEEHQQPLVPNLQSPPRSRNEIGSRAPSGQSLNASDGNVSSETKSQRAESDTSLTRHVQHPNAPPEEAPTNTSPPPTADAEPATATTSAPTATVDGEPDPRSIACIML